MTTQTRKRDDIVIVHPDEVALIDDLDPRRRRERNVANLRLVWNRRNFLWRVVASGLLLSVAVAFLIPARYTSTMKLMPPDQSPGSMLGALSALSSNSSGDSTAGLGALAGIAGDVLGVKTSSDLFIGILQSRTVQDHVINKFDLRKVYRDRRMEDARKDLSQKTELGADRKSGIITVEVTDHDPGRAAAICREYVENLNGLLVSLNTSAAHREKAFLEERLQEVQKDLKQSEKKLSEFSSKNATLDLKEQSVAMVDAAAMLEGQLVAAQTELQGLKQIYSDNNVRVRSIQARVDELRRQIQKVGGKAGVTPDNENQYVDSLYPTIRALPILGVQYADLYRDTRVQEATFAMLTREYEIAKVNEAKELPSVRVLDEPDIPNKRSYPPRTAIVCLGVLIFGAMGVGLIFGSESWKSIDPQDPGKLLATDVWLQIRDQARGVQGNGPRSS